MSEAEFSKYVFRLRILADLRMLLLPAPESNCRRYKLSWTTSTLSHRIFW